jgi:hypothetical protein
MTDLSKQKVLDYLQPDPPEPERRLKNVVAQARRDVLFSIIEKIKSGSLDAAPVKPSGVVQVCPICDTAHGTPCTEKPVAHNEDGLLHNDFAQGDAEIRAAETRANSRGDGWIPVSERLPEPCSHSNQSSSVLVWCPENRCEYTATFNHDSQQWNHFGACGYAIYYSVTHWMPLPNPPAEGVRS